MHFHSLPPFISFTWRNWVSLGHSINCWVPANADILLCYLQNLYSNFYPRIQKAFLGIRAMPESLHSWPSIGQDRSQISMKCAAQYMPQSQRTGNVIVLGPYRLAPAVVEMSLCEVWTQTPPIRQRTQLLCHRNRTRSMWRNLGKNLLYYQS